VDGARARRIALDVPGWPGHRAGQHLDVRLTAEDGYQAQRSYSIASPPGDPVLELGVEHLPDGEVSSYLAGVLCPGDRIEVRGPIGGHFVWGDPRDDERLLLVGGGSGIVPLIAIARHRAAIAADTPARLLASVRDVGDLMFMDELERLAAGGLDVRVTYTRRPPRGWRGHARRVDAGMLAEIAWPRGTGQGTYVCGPTPFVERVADLLVSRGEPHAAIRTERFGPTGGE